MNRAVQIVNQLLEADEEDPKEYIMSRLRLNPRPQDVKFYLWIEEEDHEPNWEVPNDPIDRQRHHAMMRRIRRRLEAGDNWAYGSVFVVAKYTDPNDPERVFWGDDNLGGCSYKDRNDFMRNSGYFEDMKANAYEELKKNFDKGITGPRHRWLNPPDDSEVPERYSKIKL